MLNDHGSELNWTKELTEGFEDLIQALVNAQTRNYFDAPKHITVQADACANGLGAVLLWDIRSVLLASRMLTDVEARYSQIEREFLWDSFRPD